MTTTSFWHGFKTAAAMREVATVALLSVEDHKMLMGKRRDNKRWTNPGGHLDGGENPLTGAVREVQEETGLELGEDDLVHLRSKVVTKRDGAKIRVHAYKAYLGGQKPRGTSKHDPDKEVSMWRWVKTKGGLPRYIVNNLHVPLKDNVLLSGLRLHKTASPRRLPIDREAFDKLFREAMQQYARSGIQQPRQEKRAAVSRLASLRRRRGIPDVIPGGLADNIPSSAFSRRSLDQGKRVELEHTSSPAIAEEIAKDHLAEDPDYYPKLQKMEKSAATHLKKR